MAYSYYGFETFKISEQYTINCKSQRTSYGFRHVAELVENYYIVATAKACYYNRTWESFTYQSVGHQVINKYFPNRFKAQYYIDNFDKVGRKEAAEFMKVPAMVAALGNIFGNTITEKNSWKERMLKAGVSGLDFPDDFGSLPEEEKQRRLDAVIALGLNRPS